LTLEKRIASLDDIEREKVKRNIEIIVNVFDSNSKVLAVNSNKVIPESPSMNSLMNKKNPMGSDPASIKMVNKNYKTKHCNKYHSDAGCGRGEACHFIHDIEYKGRPAPEIQRRPPKFQNGGYSNGMGSSQDKPRYPMGGFAESNPQYGSMGASYGGIHNSGMSGGYPHSMMGNSVGGRGHETAGGYPGLYKPGANYPLTNLKPDKPGINPLQTTMPMNGNHNVLRMVPPPAPPGAPPRK
jgi:hypothetical protein